MKEHLVNRCQFVLSVINEFNEEHKKTKDISSTGLGGKLPSNFKGTMGVG